MDPLSRAVYATLTDPARWEVHMNRRRVDGTADAEDLIQLQALAALEEADDRAQRAYFRRGVYHIERRRGQAHRVDWSDVLADHLADRSGAHDVDEALLARELVDLLGPTTARLVWLWAIQGYSLGELGATLGLTKQQLWRRLRGPVRQLRAMYAA